MAVAYTGDRLLTPSMRNGRFGKIAIRRGSEPPRSKCPCSSRRRKLLRLAGQSPWLGRTYIRMILPGDRVPCEPGGYSVVNVRLGWRRQPGTSIESVVLVRLGSSGVLAGLQVRRAVSASSRGARTYSTAAPRPPLVSFSISSQSGRNSPPCRRESDRLRPPDLVAAGDLNAGASGF
jgi:hypothetical protein